MEVRSVLTLSGPSSQSSAATTEAPPGPTPTLSLVGSGERRLWGLTLRQRLERAFARNGVTVAAPDGPSATPPTDVIVVSADAVIEERLIKALIATPDVILVTDEDGTRIPIAAHCPAARKDEVAALIARGTLGAAVRLEGLTILTPARLGGRHDKALRKRAAPYAVVARTTSLTDLEALTFGASYKGATDFVTKFLWPLPARAVTRWAAHHGVHPNTVTTVSLSLVLLAMALFWQGWFVTGCLVAWLMTFLDTVDGKLARVTLTSSKWGEVYDHGIDLVHPPFWWWAWWQGLGGGTAAEELTLALWVIVIGYVAGRLLEGLFIKSFGIESHVWRPVDYAFRHITARRNPNLAILTFAALAGRPDIGFLGVAVWTVISLAFHTLRLLQAVLCRLTGQTVASFLDAEG